MDDARALAGRPRVKPLEWKPIVDRATGEELAWVADTTITQYKVMEESFAYKDGRPYILEGVEPFSSARYYTVGDAKAAAFADYEARILSAIDRLAAPEGVGLTLETTAEERARWLRTPLPEGPIAKEIWRPFQRDFITLTTHIADLEARLAEATNELHCCDDIPLDGGLTAGIAALRAALADATKRIEALERGLSEIRSLTQDDERSMRAVLNHIYDEADAILSPASEGKTDG